MTNVEKLLNNQSNPKERELAQAFLKDYYGDKQTIFPINPFKILIDMGIPFVFRSLKKSEGIYIPAENIDDIPIVGINIDRPITRQRFTAAHEICHHIKDCNDIENNGIICSFNSKEKIEKYAEKFAAELLMPYSEIKKQVDIYKKSDKYISFDDVLKISLYFGVSFRACLNRIAYDINAIDGNINSKDLKKRGTEFSPNKRMEEKNFDYLYLYDDLFDVIKPCFNIEKQHVAYKFENDYVYNDSRLEDININIEDAAEIVTDIRLHKTNSEYCKSQYGNFINIAGHAIMYQHIFKKCDSSKITIYDTLSLHCDLFSCFPNPDFGGQFRKNNTLVLGAKFNTLDYSKIPNEFIKIDKEVQYLENSKDKISTSEYIKKVVELHYKLTVIHPFSDGNGRTSRAFLNLQLIRNNILPTYIKINQKDEYLGALMNADLNNNLNNLYEFFYKTILRSHSELTTFYEL